MTRNLASLLVQAALLLGAAFTLTCVEPQSVECPNGLVCPAGFECAAAQDVCIADGCGNGAQEDGEECDDGNIEAGDTCSPGCTVEECGNDIDDFGEVCDDGNTTSGDGCRADCLSDETCGNGELDEDAGEICDDDNTSSGDGCRADCISDETCGNGEIDSAVDEACDDGNTLDGDECSSDCSAGAGCGNGFVDDGEVCDDGDQVDGDGCSANCLSAEVCGNMITDFAAGEVCDDGDTESGDGCRSDCQSDESCGNDTLDPDATPVAEQCDDGGNVDGDGCSSLCILEECGNGVHDEEFGEACDDGNTSDGPCVDNPNDPMCTTSCDDGTGVADQDICDAIETGFICDELTLLCNGLDFCSHDCLSAGQGCGNGIRDLNEECDDGTPTDTEADNEDDCITGNSGDPLRCKLNSCGDGHQDLQGGSQEACDEGANTQTCDLNCTPPSCGDLFTNPNFDPDDLTASGGSNGPRPKEQCDDGDGGGDGCNDCRLEVCGDGVTDTLAGEACDDGNTSSGDGCRFNCSKTEVCGDSFIDSAAPLSETCDDGQGTPTANDGCAVNCRTETGWSCIGAGPGTCNPICGDGIEVGTETCDTGGGAGSQVNNDGCSTSCQVESGWSCNENNPDTCAPICGDGIKVGTETCDQGSGNVATGDGCSASCQVETGWSCSGTGAASCTAICGDGLIQAGVETCDQGNADTAPLISGDGCSTACQLETGWTCPTPSGNPLSSACVPICGDGLVEGTEACDDGCGGNGCSGLDNGDGCSSTCTIESGFSCNASEPTVCSAVCGNGTVQTGFETCDQGANDGVPLDNNDGCSSTCQLETGWTCSGINCTPTCGDGLTRGSEGCDDRCLLGSGGAGVCTSTDNGDGCSSTCAVETNFSCVNNTGSPSSSVCGPICGDGVKAGGETCDQGSSNVVSGDGCSSTCATETGWTCTGVGASSCVPNCGDGLVRGSEQCDDLCLSGTDFVCVTSTNAENGDGCNKTCQIEAGYSCDNEQTSGVSGAPFGVASVCAIVCGDGVLATGEACDDGCMAGVENVCENVIDDNDGCTDTCTVEAGFTCAGSPSVCVGSCGNGTISGGEQCDQGSGNIATGDGCNATCQLESGWSCTGSPSTCVKVCGDGFKTTDEGCDDGDNESGDGCSSTCAEESGWTCNETSGLSTCATSCGDGITAGTETCDQGGNDTAPLTSGDGCSATCQTEFGFTCSGSPNPNPCAVTCGDALKASTEACDDGCGGNGCTSPTDNGDGCTNLCAIESGWTCTGTQPTTCSATSCGDGIKAGSEQCDNGGGAGDGCSTTCTIEAGWTCPNNVCAAASCGDSIKAGTEACDNGGGNGDGCTTGCAIESGWVCSGTAPSSCTTVCGDNIVAGSEVCDDNNNNSCGLCNSTCTGAVTAAAATGYIFVNETGSNNLDGKTLTISDGINSVTFTFDKDAGSVAHEISFTTSDTATEIATAIATAIDAEGSTLFVDATRTGSFISLTNDSSPSVGALGNVAITSTFLANPQLTGFTIFGMAGGTANDCLSGTECKVDDDCKFSCSSLVCTGS